MTAALDAANAKRAAEAAVRTVAAARKAHHIIRAIPPTGPHDARMQLLHRQTLVARIQHPNKSLAQVAHTQGVNKDVYAARLRRAFAYAQRKGANL